MVKGWADQVETDVIGHLTMHDGASLQELAAAMGLSESLALSYVSMLAREGKVNIGSLGVRKN